MKRKDILITGGAGYIGSHAVVELYNSGYRPIIVDNFSNSSIKNIEGIEQIIKNKVAFHEFDCTDENQMNELFELENNIKRRVISREDASSVMQRFQEVKATGKQIEPLKLKNKTDQTKIINLLVDNNIQSIL